MCHETSFPDSFRETDGERNARRDRWRREKEDALWELFCGVNSLVNSEIVNSLPSEVVEDLNTRVRKVYEPFFRCVGVAYDFSLS